MICPLRVPPLRLPRRPALALLALPLLAALPVPTPAGPHPAALPRTEAEAARVAAAVAPPAGFETPERHEARPGGAATVAAAGGAVFGQPVPGLGKEGGLRFRLGEALFERLWVAAPASTRASDGLGPSYNARACADCHVNDGRGHAPDAAGGVRTTLVAHLSVPAGAATAPHPTLGRQLQDRAAPGLAAEGRLEIAYEEFPVRLADGQLIGLRKPRYAVKDLAPGEAAAGLMLSPRVAPPMIGLGLLEAIPETEIRALADPMDADGDGISGRVQQVVSAETGLPMPGRFGWKAGQPTLREQVALAFATDLGLSNPLFPVPWGDCTAAQTACRAGPHGQEPGLRDGLEVDARALDAVTFHAGRLGVPARRGLADPQVLRGKATFHDLGCAGCHVPKHVTRRQTDRPELSFQLIWPHTDLLLHDMGPGLADGRPEGVASGTEWRTPPLWGIGLTAAVGGSTQFLHDGRARSLTEAILWHGGEAQAARDGFAALPAETRAALIAFLESL